jgi:hypothetical protein
MRTDKEILDDLNYLRDRRHKISEDEYHMKQEKLWTELREHDAAIVHLWNRRTGQWKACRCEYGRTATREETSVTCQACRQIIEERQAKRVKRCAAAKRRLQHWLAQPTPTTASGLRQKLLDFLKIPAAGLDAFRLRTRQRTIRDRLSQPPNYIERTSYFRFRTSEQWLDRQANKKAPLTELVPGVFKIYDPELRSKSSGDADKAVQIAERFHRNVRRLYLSRHATVEYGHGGEQQVSWPRNWRPGRFPKKWKNAGVLIDYATSPPTIRLENYRGQLICHLQVPLAQVTFQKIEGTDLYGLQRRPGGIIERWAMGVCFPVLVGEVCPD